MKPKVLNIKEIKLYKSYKLFKMINIKHVNKSRQHLQGK
jgi:hypothetical protein